MQIPIRDRYFYFSVIIMDIHPPYESNSVSDFKLMLSFGSDTKKKYQLRQICGSFAGSIPAVPVKAIW